MRIYLIPVNTGDLAQSVPRNYLEKPKSKIFAVLRKSNSLEHKILGFY